MRQELVLLIIVEPAFEDLLARHDFGNAHGATLRVRLIYELWSVLLERLVRRGEALGLVRRRRTIIHVHQPHVLPSLSCILHYEILNFRIQ